MFWALSISLAGIGLLAAGVLWRQRKQLVQQVAEQRDQLAERDTAIALLQQQVDQAPDVDTALQHFAQQFAAAGHPGGTTSAAATESGPHTVA